MKFNFDVVIIGAGAAGLMCGLEAGKRGRSVVILEHFHKVGEKIRISGGGRCNFTNINTSPEKFLSNNLHFCKSALSKYTPMDFIKLVKTHNIKFHEKKLGQLFCDNSSMDIINMLLKLCYESNVKILKSVTVKEVEKGFKISTNLGTFSSNSLVIATGGLSIPKIGATKFGYEVARKFNLNITKTRAGLVPLTFTDRYLQIFKDLKGISVNANVFIKDIGFKDGLLFTHRGLSGPSILQISSFLNKGESISIDFLSNINIEKFLLKKKFQNNKQEIKNILSSVLPKRIVRFICDLNNISGRLIDFSNDQISFISSCINSFIVKPSGNEGYRTAEVTVGGVDTDELSSKTFETKSVPGLFFIGEVMDITGQLGGYNFQWAWSSGYVAGQYV